MANAAAAKNDFSKGPVWKAILAMGLPTVVAQSVQMLYNVVDRIYIGHIPGGTSLALTGVGLTFPIVLIITAFTNLYGQGGGPLCSIHRGRGDIATSQRIMGNCFVLEVSTALVLTVFFYLFMKPILYTFGASDETWPYACAYLQIYLAGTVFNMVGLGMNSFINAQGFGRVGMLTTVVGCVVNLVLDPLFIFVLHMGVRGAALATVISQTISCVWVLRFLTGPKALFTLQKKDFPLDKELDKRIVTLGFANFVMGFTTSITQIACNSVLSTVGGDLYVGIMTVLNSIREVMQLPTSGFAHGFSPVLGFNYGAREYRRSKDCIRWCTGLTIGLALASWLLVFCFPVQFLRLFSSDEALVAAGVPALRVFFFGFFFMAFQFSGQHTFVALGRSKYSIFFSTLRKVIIVTPLTIILPHVGGLGVMGVFLAEPISNVVGGLACYITMLRTVWRDLTKAEQQKAAEALQG